MGVKVSVNNLEGELDNKGAIPVHLFTKRNLVRQTL